MHDAAATLGENRRHGFFAVGLYSLFTVLAFWFPLVAAGLTLLSWTFWLVLSIRMNEPAPAGAQEG